MSVNVFFITFEKLSSIFLPEKEMWCFVENDNIHCSAKPTQTHIKLTVSSQGRDFGLGSCVCNVTLVQTY